MPTENHCGSCTLCCKLPSLQSDGVVKAKPVNAWCEHCEIGVGCKVYEQRPEQCSGFECLWLATQKTETPLPPELRPDKVHAVLCVSTNPDIWTCFVDPQYPEVWRANDQLSQLIGKVAVAYGPVVITHGTSTKKTVVQKHPFLKDACIVAPIELTEPDENGMQWGKHGG